MTDATPLCPTCHSKISSTGSRVKDHDAIGVPAWSDDPTLTPTGLNGPDYVGFQFNKAKWIKELQDTRTQQESDAGITPPTEFSDVEQNVTLLTAAHITELRISTERILDAVGSTLEDYFKLDFDGNQQPAGPNDMLDKKEWTDVVRGKPYDNGRNLSILSEDHKQFKINSTDTKDIPTFLAKLTYFKGIHIEDLRHPIQTKPWKEGFSQESVNNTFSIGFANQSPDLNLSQEKDFEGAITQFIGDMSNPNVDINTEGRLHNPYFVRQIFGYQPAPISTAVQIPTILNYVGTLSGGNNGLPNPPNPTPITYHLTGQLPGVTMMMVNPDAKISNGENWATYNIWNIVSLPGFITETIVNNYHFWRWSTDPPNVLYSELLGSSTTYGEKFSGNRLTTHYSEGANWWHQPWKYWYLTQWNEAQARASADAWLVGNPSHWGPIENYSETPDPGHGNPLSVLIQWDQTEYANGYLRQPLIYQYYVDNDMTINSDPSNFNDVGVPFLIARGVIRPWDFIPNHPETLPPSLPINPDTGLQILPYSPVPVQFTDETAIVITLSEKTYVVDGIISEANPVSNAQLGMDVYIESRKVLEQGLNPEQPEITDHVHFIINGPGTIINGKEVFTIYLSRLNFDNEIRRFIGKRCYFSIGLTPQITTTFSKNWHSIVWDEAVPPSDIPGDFWGTTIFIDSRNATGTITIDSVEIKKVPQPSP